MRIDYKTYALPSVHHFNSSFNRRAPDMAIQRGLGILSQRRFGVGVVNRAACCLTSLALRSKHSALRRTSFVEQWKSGAAILQRAGKLTSALQRVLCFLLSCLRFCAFGDLNPIVSGGADPPLRWVMLHLVAQRPQGVGELLKPKLQPRFHRSQRSTRRGGNFPVAESLEKSKLQRLPLKSRQNSHALL
jgi:hypothetical protein